MTKILTILNWATFFLCFPLIGLSAIILFAGNYYKSVFWILALILSGEVFIFLASLISIIYRKRETCANLFGYISIGLESLGGILLLLSGILGATSMPCVPTRNFIPHVCHKNFSNVTSLELFLILLGQNSSFLSFLIAVMQFREIKERKLREHIPARPANTHF